MRKETTARCEHSTPHTLVYDASVTSSERPVEGHPSNSYGLMKYLQNDETSTDSTSPTSNGSSVQQGEEDQSISSSSSQMSGQNLSTNGQALGGTSNFQDAKQITESYREEESLQKSSRSLNYASSRIGSLSNSVRSLQASLIPLDPNYQARRNKRIQAIRTSRRGEAKHSDGADNQCPTSPTPVDAKEVVKGNPAPETVSKSTTPPLPPVAASDKPRRPSIPLTRQASESSTASVDGSSKLQALRASKTVRESQLRNKMKDCSDHIINPPSSPPNSGSNSPTTQRSVELIEPVVYNDMREELLRAYEVIEMQKKHLEKNDSKHPSSNGSKEAQSPSAADLQRQIDELKREHASRELTLLNRLTNDAMAYKKTIDHLKRETSLWQDRFESSWDDHETQIARLKAEKEKWKERACDAENDLASFKRGTEDTLLELIRAKERMHYLEEKLELDDMAKVFTPTTVSASSSASDSDCQTPPPEPSTPDDDRGSSEVSQQASFLAAAMKRDTSNTRARLVGRFTGWGSINTSA